MINFYNQQELYFKVELKMITYQNDQRMITLVKDLDDMTQVFSTESKKVLNSTHNLIVFIQ